MCTSLLFELRDDAGTPIKATVEQTWWIDAGPGAVSAYAPGCTQPALGVTLLPGQSRATLVFNRPMGGLQVVSVIPLGPNTTNAAPFTANNLAGIGCGMTYSDCSGATASNCCNGFACDAGSQVCCSNSGTACADAGDCCSQKCQTLKGTSGTAVCN